MQGDNSRQKSNLGRTQEGEEELHSRELGRGQ